MSVMLKCILGVVVMLYCAQSMEMARIRRSSILDYAKAAMDAVKNTSEKVVSGINSTLHQVMDGVGTSMNSMMDKVNTSMNEFKDEAQDIKDQEVTPKIKTQMKPLDRIKEFIDKVGKVISEKLGFFKGKDDCKTLDDKIEESLMLLLEN